MTVDKNGIFEDEVSFDGNIPESYRAVQSMLDRFVEINYETALDAMRLHTGVVDAGHIRQQIVDIIRNNPPLQTVPAYFRDGREDYLWYSDFYDDIPKDMLSQYNKFVALDIKITPANYATKLSKIDLPYFRELVDLVVLEKLYRNAAAHKIDRKETSEPEAEPEAVAELSKLKRPERRRSYMPNLNDDQYALLEECVNGINLFRRPVSVAELTKLLNGKPAKSLQVTNQKSLTYLFDELARAGFISKTWISIADRNKDFFSFRRGRNEERYGDGPHYITSQQFSNCRLRNDREYIEGLEAVDDAIEKMQESPK